MAAGTTALNWKPYIDEWIGAETAYVDPYRCWIGFDQEKGYFRAYVRGGDGLDQRCESVEDARRSVEEWISLRLGDLCEECFTRHHKGKGGDLCNS
jgi:hypothetical protein